MIYLTFGDALSGVYKSQVIDVIKKINSINGQSIKLIAFFSLRTYWKTRREIRGLYANCLILPMFPKLHNWEKNALMLRLVLFFIQADWIIARGIFAANLALKAKASGTKLCYDGRGAIKAENEEYKLFKSEKISSEIAEMERQAVVAADFRIAVSHQLLQYWENNFNYKAVTHRVIPCSVSRSFEDITVEEKWHLRGQYSNFEDKDIVLVYAGSVAGWQSFEFAENILRKLLTESEKIKVIFLSKEHEIIQRLIRDFPTRIIRKWVHHEVVANYLKLADYGVLIREQSMTNKVASPVKFAEYLSAGLNIIISENLGDYTEMVEKHQLGVIIRDEKQPILSHLKPNTQKPEIQKLCRDFYYKNGQHISDSYRSLLDQLSKVS